MENCDVIERVASNFILIVSIFCISLRGAHISLCQGTIRTKESINFALLIKSICSMVVCANNILVPFNFKVNTLILWRIVSSKIVDVTSIAMIWNTVALESDVYLTAALSASHAELTNYRCSCRLITLTIYIVIKFWIPTIKVRLDAASDT